MAVDKLISGSCRFLIFVISNALCAVMLHRRINPFNQPQGNSASDDAAAPAADSGSTFAVRFLGSQQVLTDRGTFSTVATVVYKFSSML